MCTVIVHVPQESGEPVRLLAIRDEDPARPWKRLGPWWPDTFPGVVGVQDVRAGGAWLAARPDAARLAVLLNRAEVADVPTDALVSRGGLPLAAMEGDLPGPEPRSHGFNLVDVADGVARLTTWDGDAVRTVRLPPGTHMVAHDDLDDPATARIDRWLEEFRAATARAEAADEDSDAGWFGPWLEVLADSGDFTPEDDRAIVRDNRPLGYPTLSLLMCTATIGPRSTRVRYGEFTHPGAWERVELT